MTLFMDSFALIALLNARDAFHDKVLDFLAKFKGGFVITEWIFLEVADALCHPDIRGRVVTSIKRIRKNPRYDIVEYDSDVDDAGFDLFAKRPDKNWSLTDCISFVVMEHYKLSEALTADHHFRQAGFHPIFEKAP
jgi:uncharacterized protein